MIRFVLPLLLLLPEVAAAHGVSLSVTASGEAISGEARFADGSPMAEAVVELRRTDILPQTSSSAVASARGRTDADGRFAFPTPRAPGEFRVTVDDGIGHRGESTLQLSIDPRNHAKTAAERRVWPWREWLSGLGYVLGLFGITSWWLARRQAAAPRD